jgi:phosphoribosylanthranilate isomerase
MWVKICANTSHKDALAALEAGANALGFVFARSPRQVTPAQVASIVSSLPQGPEYIGVFAGASVEEIVEASRHARLTAIQLHGGIDTAFAAALKQRTALPLIQTVAWAVNEPNAAEEVAAHLAEVAREGLGDRVLIDARVGSASGGLGLAFDWSLAGPVFAGQPSLRLIVAGGLSPLNVAQAIRQLAPWGVDVASGVEASPGTKDCEKMRAFVENARSA